MTRIATTVGGLVLSAFSLAIPNGCSSSNQLTSEALAASNSCRYPFSDLVGDINSLTSRLDKISVLISFPSANRDSCEFARDQLSQSLDVVKYSLGRAFQSHVIATSVTEVFSDPWTALSGQEVWDLAAELDDLHHRIEMHRFGNSELSEAEENLLDDMAFLKFRLYFLAERLKNFEYPIEAPVVKSPNPKDENTRSQRSED